MGPEISPGGLYFEAADNCSDAIMSSVAEVRTVHLHADANVAGSLAFRLVGNRNSGVYVYNLQKDSQQASILEDGDRLLFCNDIPLQGFTCEQVANVLRLSMCRNGTLTLTTSREVEIKEKLIERKNKRINNAQEISCGERSHITRPRSIQLSSLEGAVHYAKDSPTASSSFTSMFNFKKSTTGEREHLLKRPEDDNKKTLINYYMFDGGYSEVDITQPTRYRCPVCLKYTSVRRLHMLRHGWLSGVRKLFPASASDFFIGRSTSDYAML